LLFFKHKTHLDVWHLGVAVVLL